MIGSLNFHYTKENDSMTIGFIGCGNMAQPIIRNIIDKNLFISNDVYIFDTDADKLTDFCKQTGAVALSSEHEIANTCDCVFLCIKPQGFDALLKKISADLNHNKPLIVSIAAGKTIGFIEKYLDNARVGRVFPNLNAAVCQACSAFCVNDACSESDKMLIERICSCFGTALFYPEEMFSQFGVLGGCSPAYTFMYIASLAKAAQMNGMNPQTALQTAIQAVLGSALYMQKSGIDPEILIDRVCSKGGTTIEGVNILRDNHLDTLVSDAYNASLRRDKELSEN